MEAYTNEEWRTKLDAVIEATETSLQPTDVKAQDVAASILAQHIDHTGLAVDATAAHVDQLCDEAVQYRFAAVCVRLNFVAQAASKLADAQIPIACVVGFHEGTQSLQSKLDEASAAIDAGATELDVVLNRTQLQAGDYAAVFHELAAIRHISTTTDAASPQIHLKLILETSMLDTRQVIEACALAGWAGWDYIKTSTGFCGHGATVPHVRLMKRVAAIIIEVLRSCGQDVPQMKVKASGGIRTYQDAVEMLAAGADRLGASAGVKIIQEALAKQQ